MRVELYADGVNGGDPVRQEMKRRGNWRTRRAVTSMAHGAGDPPGDRLYGASDTATAPAWPFRWNRLESYGNDDEDAPARVARLHFGDLRAR